MASEKANRKDKNQNIQVFVRLRPLNQRERDIKSLGVIEVANGKEVVVRQYQHTSHAKKFTFDRAFGPNAKQVEVYQDVVSPLIEEVLAGYNCTVFAYGQTGTGKTHTMVGENTSEDTSWQNDPLAGIIPRALSQLFDELRLSNTEYTVRVSYLELYNEELFDLLSSSEDNSKLRIYEDVTRKGSNIVNGLEEITVYNKNEVYKIMAQGQERKRVASTLMNAQSSRSHTVFTIVVHMKENSPEGEELMKIGKLNLVDLAGSENISKAGSDNPAKRERARECVNINQSLLTLGRVITALVERQPHIPYRESKLTRILQESLGGRTKTSIIATISPGHRDLEETLSTLEYAHRAKNIQNKPEVNQKMTKKAILKEYAEEIDRLKRDLQAARDKNGIYLANETYAEMTLKQEEQRKEIQELLLQKKAVEEKRDEVETIFNELKCVLKDREIQLDQTKNKLSLTRNELSNTRNMLKTTTQNYEEQKHLVDKHAETEAKLSHQAEELIGVLNVATGHLSTLHNAFDKSRNVESSNLELTKNFHEKSQEHQDMMKQEIDNYVKNLVQTLHTMQHSLDEHVANSEKSQIGNKSTVEELIMKIADTAKTVKSMTNSTQNDIVAVCNAAIGNVKQETDILENTTGNLFRNFLEMQNEGVINVCTVQDQTRNEIHDAIETWRTKSREVLDGVCQEFDRFTASLAKCANRADERARGDRERRMRARTLRDQRRRELYQQVLSQHESQNQFLLWQQAEIEKDKKQTELLLRLVKEIDQKNDQRMAMIQEAMNKQEQDTKMIIEWHETEEKFSEEEQNVEDEMVREHETGTSESKTCMVEYDRHFKNGTDKISADLASCSSRISKSLDTGCQESFSKLQKIVGETKETVETVTKSLKESCLHVNESAETALAGVVDSHRQCSDTLVQNIEVLDRLCSEDLNKVVQTTSTLIGDNSKNHSELTIEMDKIRSHTDCFYRSSHDAIEQQELLARMYLQDEYKKYSPTGSTPLRREYSRPRTLAATSPHERILARFRAARTLHDEDCILISGDSSPPPSEADSITSDSDSVFTVPSPPAAPAVITNGHRDTPTRTILKSTSESDLYSRKGKENIERNGSFRSKTSKLRAPAPVSLKKPLIDRNVQQ